MTKRERKKLEVLLEVSSGIKVKSRRLKVKRKYKMKEINEALIVKEILKQCIQQKLKEEISENSFVDRQHF